MRWATEPAPEDGDTRTETFFAWRPYTVGLETRWLERVTVRLMYRVLPLGCGDSYWSRWSFVDRAAGGE